MQRLTLLSVCLFTIQITVSAIGNDTSHVRELRFEPVDKERSRKVPVKVYMSSSPVRAESETAKTVKPQPVILFCHGLGGSRENNAYLGKHWAAAGHVAVFMQHPGSDNEVWKSAKRGQRFAALKAAASGVSLQNRLSDVSFVIDQLETWNKTNGHALHGRLNLERIGMSGHSFGAGTTLGVAGRKYSRDRSFEEKRLDAFLPLSPSPGKRADPKASFGHLTKPMLCMTGTKDGSPIDPTLTPDT